MKRRALLCLAIPASAVLARPALAIREQPASDAAARAWAARCAAWPAAPGDTPLAICPFCGCPVAGARDHGETGPLLPPG